MRSELITKRPTLADLLERLEDRGGVMAVTGELPEVAAPLQYLHLRVTRSSDPLAAERRRQFFSVYHRRWRLRATTSLLGGYLEYAALGLVR